MFISERRNSGAMNSQCFIEALYLKTVNVVPLLINEEMTTLASITRSI
jgi:hypothetical protein